MSWVAVAKKEFLENVRNAWVVAVTIVFLVLTLLASTFGALSTSIGPNGVSRGFAPLGTTLNAIDLGAGFLLPVLALMLGFATIAGERESGSLGLLLSQPITRGQVLVGKWLGLFGVLAAAVIVGFGSGGIFVISRTGGTSQDVNTLMLYILATLAWGAAWISVTMLLSAWFNRRGTAIAGSIGVWFTSTTFVWNLLSFLFIASFFGRSILSTSNGSGGVLPGWVILTQWLNPTAAYEGLLATSVPGYDTVIHTIAKGAGLTSYAAPGFIVALALWIALPLLGAYALFERKDA